MSDNEVTSPAPEPARTAATPQRQPAQPRAAGSAPDPEPRPAGPGGEPGHRLVAEIYITPIGTGDPSIREVIRALRPLLDASGLRYEQHPLGTIVEGPLIHVLELTRALHEFTFMADKGAARVVTHLRIDERRDGDATL